MKATPAVRLSAAARASPPETAAMRPVTWFQPSAAMKIGSGATTDKSIASGDPVITTPNRSAETRPAPTPMMKMVPIALAVPLLAAGLGAASLQRTRRSFTAGRRLAAYRIT